MGLASWIFNRGVKKNVIRKCHLCGNEVATSCLPFLGAKRFCRYCASQIMRGL